MGTRIEQRGNIAESGSTQINNVNYAQTAADIHRACFRALQCPDTLVVKNRLKENKDKLLVASIKWILEDPQYLQWREGPDVGLLWITGSAGRGKTMMSIGLIEKLIPNAEDKTVALTYFFCQKGDYELNTVEAILKGLIYRLAIQHEEVRASLRDRWDTTNGRFELNTNSWPNLWDIFMEMIGLCACTVIYIVVDALDECRDEGMNRLLKLIVRVGLGQPARIKWLLTSRPLSSAERVLLAGHDQTLISLERNSDHTSEGVQTYIEHRVTELDRLHLYGPALRASIQEALVSKAGDTFLWASLVCKQLEDVHQDEALATVQSVPAGLSEFFTQAMAQLCEGEDEVVKGCIRLLKVMMLVLRPLKLSEVRTVVNLTDQDIISTYMNPCASFIKYGASHVDFIHQSVRDYFDTEPGKSFLNRDGSFGHADIVISSLKILNKHLKPNISGLPRPSSLAKAGTIDLPLGLEYAAVFWTQHFAQAIRFENIQADEAVTSFLRTRLLEWVEWLSLTGELGRGLRALQRLDELLFVDSDSSDNTDMRKYLKDGIRFLLRHYGVIYTCPLQIYSSALIFSPIKSETRRNGLGKASSWLTDVPATEDDWTPLLQTLSAHSQSVTSVTFSPDGKLIASGSFDGTIKLWDGATGELQSTIVSVGRAMVSPASFSPDSARIAVPAPGNVVELRDVATAELQVTLRGPRTQIHRVVFSPDGKRLLSASFDGTVTTWYATGGTLQSQLFDSGSADPRICISPDSKLIILVSYGGTVEAWDIGTGKLQTTFEGRSRHIQSMHFSPHGKQMATGSSDSTIKVWKTETGQLQHDLVSEKGGEVTNITFSPDGNQLVSGGSGRTLELWDTETGELQRTLAGHSSTISHAVFSPDGNRVVSASHDHTIKIWDAATGELQKTLGGHTDAISAVALSPDGKRIASGSDDNTVKLWESTTDESVGEPDDLSDPIRTLIYSPDGRHIASRSRSAIRLYDSSTGALQSTICRDVEDMMTMAFSPDSKIIASGSYDENVELPTDENINLWDVPTGELRSTLRVPGAALDIAFSPDGRLLAVSGVYRDSLTLWDIGTGELHKTLIDRPLQQPIYAVQTMQFSPDGVLIASSDGGKIKLWDTRTGRLQSAISAHSGQVHTVAFSADGKQLASASLWDDDVKVWDVAKSIEATRWFGQFLGTNLGSYLLQRVSYPDKVLAVRFSSNDKLYLVTDNGPYEVEGNAAPERPDEIYVAGCWVCSGNVRVLALPAEWEHSDGVHAVRDGQVAIIVHNGRILMLNIDRQQLASELG